MDASESLIKLLTQLELIKNIHAEQVYSASGEKPIRHLAKMGILEEEAAIEQVAKKLSIRYLDLDDRAINATLTIEKFVGQLDADKLWDARVIPLFEDNKAITVAFANPLDIDIRKQIEFKIGKAVNVVISGESKITRLLTEHFPATRISYDKLNKDSSSDSLQIVGISDPATEQVSDEDAAAPPVVRLVNKILADSIKAKASDIHIEPMQYAVEVRFRVDGVMRPFLEIPKRMQPFVATRIKILSGMDIAERRKPQDGRFRIKSGETTVDMRVSALPTAFGETLVLRLLRGNSEGLTFPELGLVDAVQRRVLRVLNTDSKMFLVTGPTGSGKTTTLYTALHYLKDGTSNIMTVEDPIEYRIPGINQVQVNEVTGVTFASTLRSILRQDPDVIMIGEIRDSETAQIAVQAAQTGHKVLSTLHTNDAPSAISRLYDLGIPSFILASCLGGILAQRLVRKLCPDCTSELNSSPDTDLTEVLSALEIEPSDTKVGIGCVKCNFSGYKGRIGLYSFLEITGRVERLVADNSPISEIETEAMAQDFQSVPQAALAAVLKGETDLKEVLPYLRVLVAERRENLSTEIVPGISAPAQSVGPVPLQVSPPRPGEKLSKPKVLLVEDDHDVRAVMAMLLKREMFEVVEAENGQQALERVYEGTPNVVLCDLMMPVMDGREFLSRMRANPVTKEIPIVILTAADSEQNEVGLLELGARDFLSKTAPSAVMLARIRHALKF